MERPMVVLGEPWGSRLGGRGVVFCCFRNGSATRQSESVVGLGSRYLYLSPFPSHGAVALWTHFVQALCTLGMSKALSKGSSSVL